MPEHCLRMYNGQPKAFKDIPCLSFEEFRSFAVSANKEGARIVSFFGHRKDKTIVQLILVIAYDNEGFLKVISTLTEGQYPSLTQDMPQIHLFEREIFEQFNIRPEKHPWLKPVRIHSRYEDDSRSLDDKDLLSLATRYFRVRGEEIHEVAVGPVHAGIIEPGHFRFQCHGERVFHLEISLGYQHRGIESAIVGGPDKRTIHYMETASGDTTAGHSLAYCQAIEGLSNSDASLRASVLRSIMLELERLANHAGDLGALANDAGFLPTSSYLGRLRGDFLNMTALICGNRFGRNMIKPGGVMFDLDAAVAAELKRRLKKTFLEVKNAVNLMWDSSLVVDRFDETGIVTKQAALDLGLVGVAARACGIERDTRFDFPAGAFRFSRISMSTCASGDVFARAFVRWLEIQRSTKFILDQLENLPAGNIMSSIQPMKSDSIIASLVEGWRGEICHVAITDQNGSIIKYKIVDPSFHNWAGLAISLRGEEISNFPLCNKSFNLSYCGHDL